MTDLKKFLKKHVAQKKYTHFIQDKKYDIPDNKYDDFIRLYSRTIIKGVQIRVLEKHKEFGPICIEIECHKKYLTEKYIKKVITSCNKIIKKYLETSTETIESYVIRNNTTIKIMYPYICTKPSFQKIIINELSKNELRLIKKINEKSIYQQDIALYKSKDSGELIHLYNEANKKVFDILIPDQLLENVMTKHLIKILSIRKFNSDADNTFLKDGVDPYDLDCIIKKIKSEEDKIKEADMDEDETDDNTSSSDVNNKTSLNDFLLKYKAKKGEEFTHTSMIGGSWNIPDKFLEKFYKVYSKEVQKIELHLTEKHKPEYGPIVIDLDFKFKKKINPRPIDKKLIKKIVITIVTILKNIFGDEHDYTCFVLQRPKMCERKGIYCDGLHIQLPNIVCEYMFQYALRNKFINEFKYDIGCENELGNIYDESVIKRNNWCLYLSTKQGIKPYKIVALYNSNLDLDKLTVLDLVKILSIRNKNEEDLKKPINYNIVNDFVDKVTKHEKSIIRKDKEFKPLEITPDQEYNEQLIRKLLNMLNQERVDNYDDWMRVGMILHYCSVTDKNKQIDYYKLWNKWSSNSNKYSKKSCERQWGHFKNIKTNHLSLGSLFYYAKQDNPESYNKLKISEYIQKQQETFPDNNLVITDIVNKGHTCYAELKDNYCPFIEGVHDENHKSMYIEVTSTGLCLKCKNCPYEILPIEGHVKLPNSTLQSVFGIENMYNNVTINNNYDSKSILETFAIHKSEYDVFEDKTLNELVYLSLNGTGFKIAELVYYLYKDKFNCTINDIWYEYKNHRWRLGAPVLFKLISSDVTKYHVKLLDFYSSLKTNNKQEREHIEYIKKVISGVIKNLETTTFKNNIMQDICSTFYLNNKEFESELDKRAYLIGFENGVYDLETHEFRDGCPDDNITMSVEYDYIEKHTKHKNALLKFLEDILPNEDDRDFLLKYTATGLTAANKEEVCVILSYYKNNLRFNLFL